MVMSFFAHCLVLLDTHQCGKSLVHQTKQVFTHWSKRHHFSLKGLVHDALFLPPSSSSNEHKLIRVWDLTLCQILDCYHIHRISMTMILPFDPHCFPSLRAKHFKHFLGMFHAFGTLLRQTFYHFQPRAKGLYLHTSQNLHLFLPKLAAPEF